MQLQKKQNFVVLCKDKMTCISATGELSLLVWNVLASSSIFLRVQNWQLAKSKHNGEWFYCLSCIYTKKSYLKCYFHFHKHWKILLTMGINVLTGRTFAYNVEFLDWRQQRWRTPLVFNVNDYKVLISCLTDRSQLYKQSVPIFI